MQIQKIFIRNFRSIGEEGLELTFPLGITTFIGENNVGKSSIFQAIKMIINLNLEKRIEWGIENWNISDQRKTIEIVITISLNDEDILKIIPIFKPLDISIDYYKRSFSDQLTYKILVAKPSERPESFFSLGNVTIYNNRGRFGEFNGENPTISVEMHKLAETEVCESIEIDIKKQAIKDWNSKESFLRDHFPNPNNLDISKFELNFQKNISEHILEFLKENILPIDEYREKPKEELNSSMASPTGIELASILFKLKNRRKSERSKFEKIQRKFKEVFPNLNLDVIQEEKEVKIYIEKENIESTTHFLGAGIIQTLLLITYLIAHENKIILVDHPELYLHPQAERNLASIIAESKNPQILLISHSPYFVSLNKQHTIFRFVQKDNKTVIKKTFPNYFNSKDYLKFEYLLDVDSKEIFFARKVLLVEGATEYGAMPVFAESEGYSFDKNGISIIEVGGKSNLTLYAKICRGFDIPYLILADNDAKNTLEENKESVIFLPKDFEALLPDDLMKRAKRNVGKSKPRVGKYVAREIVKSNLEIPKEISEVILKLKEMKN